MSRKTLLIIGLISFVLSDIFLNGMNAAVFASGEGWEYKLSLGAFLLLAFAFAIASPIISYHGDSIAQNKAFLAAMLSAGLSVMSVYTAINIKSQSTVDNVQQRQMLLSDLEDKDKKIRQCRRDAYCNSENMRESMAKKEAQLRAISGNYAIDRNSIEHKMKLAMFVMIALLCPFISCEFSRQLGTFGSSGAGSRSSHSSSPRNSRSSKSEPVPKIEEKPEPKPDLHKKKATSEARVRSAIPTDAEHQKLKKAYRGMLLRKERVTNETLAKKAGIRKAVAGWWRKNTDLETIIGTEIAPIGGKPKLSIVE